MTQASGKYIDREIVSILSCSLISNDLSVLHDHFCDLGVPLPIIKWSPENFDLDEEILRVLLAYWSDLPHGQHLPLASELDALEMKRALGSVILLDVEDDGWDYRYRVYGSNIAEHSGFDGTGMLVSEIPAKTMAPFIAATYRACLERFEFMFTRHVVLPENQVESWDRLILPLEDGAGHINRLLVGKIPGAHQLEE